MGRHEKPGRPDPMLEIARWGEARYVARLQEVAGR